MRVSWDLLRLPAKIKEAKTAEKRAELVDMRRRIAAASVMVQVNLAYLELGESRTRIERPDAIEANRRILLKGLQDAGASGKGTAGDALAAGLRHPTAHARRTSARSDYMAAFARLVSGLGLELGGRGDELPGQEEPRPAPAEVTAKAKAGPQGGGKPRG